MVDQRPKRTTLAIALSARRGAIGACPTSRPAPLLCAAASAGVENGTSVPSVPSAAASGEPSASGTAVDAGTDSTVALGKRSVVSVAFCAERSWGE